MLWSMEIAKNDELISIADFFPPIDESISIADFFLPNRQTDESISIADYFFPPN